MRVCFDTNVVIDILGNSEWIAASLAAYDVANLNRFDAYLTASMVPDIAYILHRRGLSRRRVREKLPSVFEMFDIMDVTASDCQAAAASPMDDYEDALIAASAHRNGVDLIITRDKTGFDGSPVASMTPFDFVRAFKPADIDYAEVDLGSGSNALTGFVDSQSSQASISGFHQGLSKKAIHSEIGSLSDQEIRDLIASRYE